MNTDFKITSVITKKTSVIPGSTKINYKCHYEDPDSYRDDRSLPVLLRRINPAGRQSLKSTGKNKDCVATLAMTHKRGVRNDTGVRGGTQ